MLNITITDQELATISREHNLYAYIGQFLAGRDKFAQVVRRHMITTLRTAYVNGHMNKAIVVTGRYDADADKLARACERFERAKGVV